MRRACLAQRFAKSFSMEMPFYRYASTLKSKPLQRKKVPKAAKVIPSVDDLLKSGAIQTASSIKSKNKTTRAKYPQKKRTPEGEESTEETNFDETENDPLLKGNIQTIGKCIKFIEAGEPFITWINKYSHLLAEFSTLPQAKLRFLIKETAKDLFEIDSLRELQTEAVLECIRPVRRPCHLIILSGTGSGKSMIYWLSSVLQEYSERAKVKLFVIVCPLVSLLNDQFLQIEPKGIPTAVYYGKVSAYARKTLFERVKKGDFRMIYTTPEKLVSRPFMGLLEEVYHELEVQIVVDEAHCISEWGHDFRPQYLNMNKLRGKFDDIPILCTTATATPATLMDIRKALKIPYASVMKGNLTRQNLQYIVKKKAPVYVQDIVDLIQERWVDSCGIVYCLTRDEADKMNQSLLEANIASGVYHSGMGEAKKNHVQMEWMEGRVKVMVATVAFGMGIDKKDVRYVIHSCIPTSLEAYYQQAGRAGRDGKEATCVLYFRDKDRSLASSVIASASKNAPTEEFPMDMEECRASSYLDRKQEQLDDIVSFSQNKSTCRQTQILQFFNEPVPTGFRCGTCDVCELDMTKESVI